MIEFRNLTKKKIEYRIFKNLYKKIFKKQYAKFELSVVFAGPAFMRKINRKLAGKNKEANVLALPLEKDKRGEIFLNTSEEDLPYLFTHGALHLLGYDHKKENDSKKMENKEKQLLGI